MTNGCSYRAEHLEIITIRTEDGIYKSPAISGDIVIWLEHRNGVENIYGYNLLTNAEFPIFSRDEPYEMADYIKNPDVSGDIVVWEQVIKVHYLQDNLDHYDSDIWGCNIVTGERFPICTDEGNQSHPRISGEYVYWRYNYQIWVYDLITKQVIVKLPTEKYKSDSYCKIEGENIIWQINSTTLKGYNLKDRSEYVVTSKLPDNFIDINGENIFYIDKSPTSSLWRQGRSGDAVIYNIKAQTSVRLPKTWAPIDSLIIKGDIILWNTGTEVFGYDLKTKTSFSYGDEARFILGNESDFDGNTIVWTRTEFNNDGIFVARINPDPN
ncbi:MAG: hypothetical protein PHE50_08585 [Dehalococcoidales bacterium]|nr:hypothetical protein [Dehalococcoidales bacterium]